MQKHSFILTYIKIFIAPKTHFGKTIIAEFFIVVIVLFCNKKIKFEEKSILV